MADIQVELEFNHLPDLIKAIDDLCAKSVYVGIPHDPVGEPQVMQPADEAYLVEKGDPINGESPKPFLVPAVEKAVLGSQLDLDFYPDTILNDIGVRAVGLAANSAPDEFKSKITYTVES